MSSPVAEAFAARERRDPAAAIAWTPDGVRTCSDLAALARDIAGHLHAMPDGARIAIGVRDPFTFLAAALAVWQRSGCAVLLDANDPRAPRADLAARFGAHGLLVDTPALRCTALPGGEPADGLAAIKLTSGSTDEPRGIGVDAAALIADCDALLATMGIGEADRILAAVPMSFSYGLGSVLMPALWRSVPVVLPDARHPLGLLHALRAGEPTVLPGVPALLRALLGTRGGLPPSLRSCLSAGALLSPAIAVAFRRQFGLPVHAFYGATEAGGICYDRKGDAAERGSVGEPVDGVRVEIAADGRVVVRSPAVGRALASDPDLRLGVFTSSDLGEFRGGELVLLGRANDVFDVGGHKVHPREIERVIAAMAGVEDVVVVPWQDDAGRAVCGAIVVANGVDEAALRRHCVRHLPPAKVPRRVSFVRELPRTSRGKLSRDELQQLLVARTDSA